MYFFFFKYFMCIEICTYDKWDVLQSIVQNYILARVVARIKVNPLHPHFFLCCFLGGSISKVIDFTSHYTVQKIIISNYFAKYSMAVWHAQYMLKKREKNQNWNKKHPHHFFFYTIFLGKFIERFESFIFEKTFTE